MPQKECSVEPGVLGVFEDLEGLGVFMTAPVDAGVGRALLIDI